VTGRRLQHRISLDSSMGALYEWLSSLDPATRAREVVYLVRLGAEVHLGAKAVQLSVPASPQVAQPPVVPGKPEGDSVATTMAAWNLAAMCTPPPRSK
jgi:hypothetical protein